MIYVDSSVLLARVFAEDVSPPDELWDMALISSRLLLYEVWTRVHGQNYRLPGRNGVEMLLKRVELIELRSDVLERALRPLPLPLRTLDALHVATMEFLRRHGQQVTLASYDQRLLAVASALGFEAATL